MAKSKGNTYPHTKIILAGFLTTKSLVRDTAQLLYTAKYSTQKERNKAVMGYLHSLGVSSALVFDDFSSLFEAVFPIKAAGEHSPFPIFLDYDQDNCDYVSLVAGATDLDQAS